MHTGFHLDRRLRWTLNVLVILENVQGIVADARESCPPPAGKNWKNGSNEEIFSVGKILHVSAWAMDKFNGRAIMFCRGSIFYCQVEEVIF